MRDEANRPRPPQSRPGWSVPGRGPVERSGPGPGPFGLLQERGKCRRISRECSQSLATRCVSLAPEELRKMVPQKLALGPGLALLFGPGIGLADFSRALVQKDVGKYASRRSQVGHVYFCSTRSSVRNLPTHCRSCLKGSALAVWPGMPIPCQ